MTTSYITDESLPEGKELLNGLYEVQKYLLEIEHLQLAWGGLAKQIRDYIIDTKTTSGKAKYGILVIGIFIAAFTGLFALLTGNFFSLAAVLAVFALYFVGKAKKKEKLVKGGLYFLLLFLFNSF